METPNFRIAVRLVGEDKEDMTTLQQFLVDNEGSPDICARVSRLEPGQETSLGAGTLSIRRLAKTESRYSHFKVPIRFDGAESATITIDRKRLTMAIRPARRRSVFEMDLSEFAQAMLERQAKSNILAKRKERKKARLARRK